MRRSLAVVFLFLAACPWINPQPTPPPGPRPLSGRLQPESLELTLTTGATDAQSQHSQTAAVQVTLVNGRLPADVFAPQRESMQAAIASWPLDDTKKAELQAGIAQAFTSLAADIDKSLDELPRRMKITTTSPPLGARFAFTNAKGQSFANDGLYNPDTTEYFLAAIGFANGGGNQQLALLGLTAATFSGFLNRTLAELRLNAAGVLAVANVGAVSVSIELKTTLRYTNDQ